METTIDSLDGSGTQGLVSVVIPTYNRAYIVGRAIASVLEQSYGDVEVIVADDGSTDETRRVVEGFGPRVRHVHQENAGVAAARNLGLRQARGEFVGLLDSDDRWLPWKLEAQVRLLRAHPDVGMVWTDMAAVDDAGAQTHPTYLRTMYSAHGAVRIEEVIGPPVALSEVWPGAPAAIAGRPFYRGDLFPSMILGNLVHTSTVLLRRDRLRRAGGFDESFRPSGEDYEFHLRTCFHGPVGFLDAPSIEYRVGAADQLTAPEHRVHIARHNLATVLRWSDRGRDRLTLPRRRLRRHLADAYGWLGEEELDRGDRRGARAHLGRSLGLRPGRPRTALLLAFSLLPPSFLRAARHLRRRTSGARRRSEGEPA